MKTPIKSLVAATSGFLLIATATLANQAIAWSQLGFTVELSSGTLNIAPAGAFNDASAAWNNPAEPFNGADAATTSDGYAFASAGSSTGISTTINADNYFLVDAFALTDAIANVNGSAAATTLAFYDLSFSNVVGANVTLTLTPAFYASSLSEAAGSFSYVSAFLALGSESFLSAQDSSSSAGWADFLPITLTVGAGETVQLNAVVSAGVSVPEAGGTLSLMMIGFGLLVALPRRLAGFARP